MFKQRKRREGGDRRERGKEGERERTRKREFCDARKDLFQKITPGKKLHIFIL
jgi:hypothetical protein